MMTDGIVLGVGLLVLLAFSGAFSASETALFSLSSHRLRDLQRSADHRDHAVARAMGRPRRILVTILLGNLVVNILSSSLGTAFAIRVSGSTGLGVLLATLVMTFLILVLGEILPKTVAYRRAEPLAGLVARPLLALSRALSPLVRLLLWLTELVLGTEPHDDHRVDLDEAHTMLHLAHDEGEVGTRERDLVRGVFELGTSPLEDVMTPRTEIVSLPASMRVAEARLEARGTGLSKFPVSTGEPDEMAGVVTALDLLLADPDATLADVAREVRWVPEVKPALALLGEFRRSGERLALVVDEHGHLSGLVTLTDLLEEISGEMVEAGDVHKVRYDRLDGERIIVPARMEIRFFNEEFGTTLASAEAETIGGLVLERTGRIPQAGEVFECEEGPVLRVVKAEPHRLVTLEARLPTPAPRAGARAGARRSGREEIA